jgi:hypothetical protein
MRSISALRVSMAKAMSLSARETRWIDRCPSDVEPLRIACFDYGFDPEPAAAGRFKLSLKSR